MDIGKKNKIKKIKKISIQLKLALVICAKVHYMRLIVYSCMETDVRRYGDEDV